MAPAEEPPLGGLGRRPAPVRALLPNSRQFLAKFPQQCANPVAAGGSEALMGYVLTANALPELPGEGQAPF